MSMARLFFASKYLAAGLAVVVWAKTPAAPVLALDTTRLQPFRCRSQRTAAISSTMPRRRSVQRGRGMVHVLSGGTPEVDEYLDNRKLKGFNTVVLMLMTHLDPINRAGQGPFTVADDFSTPNEAYFSFIDATLDKAAAKGMVVLLAYTYLGYQGGDEGWWSMITNAKTPRRFVTSGACGWEGDMEIGRTSSGWPAVINHRRWGPKASGVYIRFWRV